MISKTKSSVSSPSLSIISRNPNHYQKGKTHLLLSSPRKAWPSLSNHIKWEGLRVIRGKKALKRISALGGSEALVTIFSKSSPIPNFSLLSGIVVSIPYHSSLLAKASNCLFDDLGYDGCVIQNRIEFLERNEPGIYRAGSGFPFNRLGVQSSSEGYTGLEFAGESLGLLVGLKPLVLSWGRVCYNEGRFQSLNRTDLKFGYRLSPFQNMKNLAAIVAVTFQLKHSASARRMQQQYLESWGAKRWISVPQSFNLGVTAGELIERAGLERLVKEKVYQRFGVQLKEEVLYVHPHGNV
ncbi:UDP-N-acetylenolpyruvoylglucosamine reductase [Vitis vinifera]|uniref:UDP-N-acetylenolpyruvoylglucosamine reductase n=1 Tax=Vitis vinifera TaxID=29760 RepID=A0A438HJA5_VITVI|nr:UDP-N-acetylenolpyruvoylglucosamine reductase [Vitis vinifera]